MRLSLVLASLISLLSLLSLCGCGGSSSVLNPPAPQFTIASGDWSTPLVGSGSPPLLLFGGGFLTQNGATVSGIIHLIDFPCLNPFTDDLVMTGTVSGNSVTLSSAPLRGEVVTLSLNPSPGQSGTVVAMEGTGTLTGPCPGSSTVAARLVPPTNGTFAGTFNSSGLSGADLSASLSESGPDVHGYFHIAGDLTLTGSPCFSSATITDSTVFGGDAVLNLDTDSGQASMTAVPLFVSATAPEELAAVLVIQSGPCANLVGSALLKKQ